MATVPAQCEYVVKENPGACRKPRHPVVHGSPAGLARFAAHLWSRPMIPSGIAAKLTRCARADVRGRHSAASLIDEAVSWYLRDPLSCRDREDLFPERGVEVDHRTLNRRALAAAPPSSAARARSVGRVVPLARHRQARRARRLPADGRARSRWRQAVPPHDAGGSPASP